MVLVLFSAVCIAASVWRQLFRVNGHTQNACELPGFLLVGLNGFLVLVALAVEIEVIFDENPGR